MAWGLIKSQQGSGASVVTLATTVQSVRVGDLVVVNIKFTSAGPSAVSVTDNASTPNTYTSAIGPITNSTSTMYQFYGVAVVGGATSVTVNWTTSATLRVTVEEFSGGQKTNATVFDVAGSSTGTGTTGTLTLAPAAAGELISAAIGFASAPSAITKGTGYIIGTNNTSTTTEYRQVGTTSETAPITWTTSEAWAEIAGAYNPLSGVGNFLGLVC
jgi:hypothetical protein